MSSALPLKLHSHLFRVPYSIDIQKDMTFVLIQNQLHLFPGFNKCITRIQRIAGRAERIISVPDQLHRRVHSSQKELSRINLRPNEGYVESRASARDSQELGKVEHIYPGIQRQETLDSISIETSSKKGKCSSPALWARSRVPGICVQAIVFSGASTTGQKNSVPPLSAIHYAG